MFIASLSLMTHVPAFFRCIAYLWMTIVGVFEFAFSALSSSASLIDLLCIDPCFACSLFLLIDLPGTDLCFVVKEMNFSLTDAELCIWVQPHVLYCENKIEIQRNFNIRLLHNIFHMNLSCSPAPLSAPQLEPLVLM